jgi:predicted transcriptional regulator
MLARNSFAQVRRNRRDSLLIASDMLSYAVGGIGKTELMSKVGLSSAQLNRYMPSLIRSELLEIRNHQRKPMYKTTAKGKNFLATLNTLIELLS